MYMFRLIVTIQADFFPDGRHRSVFLRKYALCSMRYELDPYTWCTDRRPRDDPARVVGMSGAVRGTSGHMWDYRSVGGSDRPLCYHPYPHTHTHTHTNTRTQTHINTHKQTHAHTNTHRKPQSFRTGCINECIVEMLWGLVAATVH